MEQSKTEITNEKALAITKYVKDTFELDMLWSTKEEDPEKNLIGFTKFGGVAVFINHDLMEKDGIAVSLNGDVGESSVVMHMMANTFELTAYAPYVEQKQGGILFGDEAYKQHSDDIASELDAVRIDAVMQMKEMESESTGGLVGLDGDPIDKEGPSIITV